MENTEETTFNLTKDPNSYFHFHGDDGKVSIVTIPNANMHSVAKLFYKWLRANDVEATLETK